MSDPRRLSTGDVLSMGILNKEAPTFGEPEGRQRARWDVEGGTREEFIKKVEDIGNVVDCSEYYGIPLAWKKDEGGYRGILLQYRSVTEERDFDTVEEAADWFIDTANSVAG